MSAGPPRSADKIMRAMQSPAPPIRSGSAGDAVVVALCRTGFEAEAAADIALAAGLQPSASTIAPEPGSAYVIARLTLAPRSFEAALARHPPIFARSLYCAHGPVTLADRRPIAARGMRADRVAPLLEAVAGLGRTPIHAPPWRSAWVEFPDSNEGKALSTLARALQSRLEAALSERGMTDPEAQRRLHVFLPDGATAYVGTSSAALGSAWPLGIPRLAMPRGAPSRSTLKLAEAFATFLGADEPVRVRAGMRAVDLGAAPGGWSWQLARRGVRVTAVDNGPLKGEAAADPLITHVRADGLTFRPRRPVDWLVCDIVLQPSRIADLVARWLAHGDARRAIFNLKLPMKKRYEAVRACEARIGERLAKSDARFQLALRQLYHDREEVTGYLARVD